MIQSLSVLSAAVIVAASSAAFAQEDAPATAAAVLKDAAGAEVGTATFTETPVGVLIAAELKGLPPGVHGFHLHETGKCEPPFETAGDHFNPTSAEHGYVEGGPHAGDMPNVHVPESGALTIEVLNTEISLEEDSLESLFDDDGSAILVHAHADDYRTQPSGEAGDRIACGIVEKQG